VPVSKYQIAQLADIDLDKKFSACMKPKELWCTVFLSCWLWFSAVRGASIKSSGEHASTLFPEDGDIIVVWNFCIHLPDHVDF